MWWELNQGLRRSSSPSKKLFEMECLSWHMDLAGHPSFHNLKPIEGICWILSHFAKDYLYFQKLHGRVPNVSQLQKHTCSPSRWQQKHQKFSRGREQIGVHTCDRRSSRTDYVEHFPKVDVSHVKHDEEQGVLYANGVQPWVVGIFLVSTRSRKSRKEYTFKKGIHLSDWLSVVNCEPSCFWYEKSRIFPWTVCFFYNRRLVVVDMVER